VKIFSGTSNPSLAERITESIGIPLGKCTVSSFPDGETFVKIEENVRGEDVFVMQSTRPADEPSFDGVFIMMDALRVRAPCLYGGDCRFMDTRARIGKISSGADHAKLVANYLGRMREQGLRWNSWPIRLPGVLRTSLWIIFTQLR